MKPDYSFESFKITEDNANAFERALEFAKGEYKGALCIFGVSGSGKTHLLNAVKNYITTFQPEESVYITNAADLLELWLNTVIKNRISFRHTFRETDVFLIDDIQRLCGKQSTQEEFVLLFNHFYENGKRIMITAPINIDDRRLEERLNSRLFFGEKTIIRESFIKTIL